LRRAYRRCHRGGDLNIPAAIQLKDVTKLFRGVPVVDGLTLCVEKGVLFGFLGPNGAGKTTTVRMMAGILRPTSGQVLIQGVDLAENPTKAKRTVGFIPDRPFLYEKLTGSEFLRFVRDLYGTDPEPAGSGSVAPLLSRFGLIPWADDLIESYSHGMKQRLIMCAALVHRPSVIIVDEPMVGLDPRGRKLVKTIFREEVAKGNTIFMSTHSLGVAQEICDEIAIIDRGKIIAQGTMAALRAQSGVNGDLESVFLRLTETEEEGPDALVAAP
jgi:ABC-2 type transport system ATP-binding protein